MSDTKAAVACLHTNSWFHPYIHGQCVLLGDQAKFALFFFLSLEGGGRG